MCGGTIRLDIHVHKEYTDLFNRRALIATVMKAARAYVRESRRKRWKTNLVDETQLSP